jgi:cell division protein FtsB
MKKIVAGLVLVLCLCSGVSIVAQNSQVYWHDQAQKQAQKLQKQQQKAYKKALKQQEKLLKKEQKQAKKDAKASHYPKDITR